MQIAGNHTEVFNCYFNSPQGTGAAHVNNALNCISGTTSVINCYFFGTGITSGNAFNNYPPLIRSCPGYSPAGLQTAPTIGGAHSRLLVLLRIVRFSFMVGLGQFCH